MKSRKGELLELLRQQQDSGRDIPPSRPGSTASYSPTSPSLPTHGVRTRWLALVGAVLVVPVAALAFGLFGGGDGLAAASTPKLDISSPTSPPATPSTPPAARNTGVAGAGVTTQPEFGIQVITYKQNPRNLELARAVGRFLVAEGLPQVLPLQVSHGEESFIEIYVGSAVSAMDMDLARLRGKLQAMQYPEGSGRKPFASAFTAPIPSRIQ